MLTRSLLCATAAFALSACTYSVSGHGDNRSVESAGLVASRDVDVPGDAEFSGMFVGADGDVGGDLDLAGASVRSSAHVGGNLTAAGGRVRFTGEVAGDAEIDAGTGYVDAIIRGDAVIAAGRITLDGRIEGALEMDGGRMILRADIAGPVQIRGQGRDDSRNGRVDLAGRLRQGGLICAAEVNIRRAARIEGDLRIISDNRPDGDGFTFEALAGRDCDRV
ncbi:hypothetical protein [Maricaulis maris]|uniref:hypothetical protein n=1 Tax=Maricaulis maris TaxID=74318 RepID=UPI0026EF3685|nr:hypothetical protein [Maricaulis maris]